jgi:hypothetical protein
MVPWSNGPANDDRRDFGHEKSCHYSSQFRRPFRCLDQEKMVNSDSETVVSLESCSEHLRRYKIRANPELCDFEMNTSVW